MSVNFRQELLLKPWETTINYSQSILLLGSCFTENMYQLLHAHKFDVQQNPHGILFNPLSIAQAISDYAQCRLYAPHDLVLLNEAWHSWQHHKAFSSPEADHACHSINEKIVQAHQKLPNIDWCIITLGSAFVYELKREYVQQNYYAHSSDNDINDMPVANCHRAPTEWFRRRLLAYDELLKSLHNIVHTLHTFNPAMQLIFTISPVRHLREGFIDNNRSKAALLTAVHELVAQYTHLHYFPSYELVLDDLRDYRFYADDMAHPNYAATQYVWQKFNHTCFDAFTQKMMPEVAKTVNAYNYVPFNANSTAHRRFLADFLQKTLQLQTQLPFLNWEAELAHFAQ